MHSGFNGPRVYGGQPGSSSRPAGRPPSTNGQRPSAPLQQILGNAGIASSRPYGKGRAIEQEQNPLHARHPPSVPIPPSISHMFTGPSSSPARPAPSTNSSRTAPPVDLGRVRGGRVTKASTGTPPRTSAQERVDQQRERRLTEASKRVRDLKARITDCESKRIAPSKELRDAYDLALSTLSHYKPKPAASSNGQVRTAPAHSVERPLPTSSKNASPPSQIPAAPNTSTFAKALGFG